MRQTLLILALILYSITGHAQSVKITPANPALAAKLDSIYDDDVKYRLQSIELEKKAGYRSKEVEELSRLTNKQDSLNLVKVKAVIAQYGWLGKETVGEKGNSALFLVIQHADLATQLTYLPMMKEAVANGKLSPGRLAILEDRIAIHQGRKQIYGSQLSTINQITRVSPIEDPDNVDKRRKEVGLIPLAQYLLQWGIVWDAEEHKKLPSFNPALSAELDTIFNDNQNYRPQLVELVKKYGASAVESKKMLKTINQKDAVNLSKVKVILNQYGFPGIQVAGAKGNLTIQLVLLQSDVSTQKRYLPQLRAAVTNGTADTWILARIENNLSSGQKKSKPE
jgi:hypothetical protein